MAAKGKLTNPDGRHLSEGVFRAYEPYLMEFANAFPGPIVFRPTAVAATTFSSRLRDAINAFIQHRYSSRLDPETFAELWKTSAIRINLQDGHEVVVMGPKKVIALPVAVAPDHGSYALILTSPSLAQFNAAINTIVSGASHLPVRIEGALPEGFILPPEVLMSPTPDGAHILI